MIDKVCRARIFNFTGQEYKPGLQQKFISWFCNYMVLQFIHIGLACARWLLKIRLARARYKSPAASPQKQFTVWTGPRFHMLYIYFKHD